MSDGHLRYGQDAQGNQIPDFSYVGYRLGNAVVPHLPVTASIAPERSGDDTYRIQHAIDTVADAGGGAVLLASGTYRIGGTIRIATSGVVLRGSGDATVLDGTGAPHTLVVIAGTGAPQQTGPQHIVTDGYVPVGARRLTLHGTSGLAVGQQIIVQRPITQAWIDAIGMNHIPPRDDGGTTTQWQPSGGLRFQRTIVGIAGDRITLDVALPQAIEREYTTATVRQYTFGGRIHNSGLEDLSGDGRGFESDPSWHGGGFFASGLVSIDAATDSWVANVTATRFGSAFNIGPYASRVSILNTASLDESVPQDIHGQPAAYTISGQESLVLGCRVTGSNLHAWITEAGTAGPDVFSHCSASNTGGRILDAGPHQRWAAGILFDDIQMDSTGLLQVSDRGNAGSGQGWDGANSVLWHCAVGRYSVERPPTAYNWAFGCTGTSVAPTPGHTDGVIVSAAATSLPGSLYDQQLEDRGR